MSAEPDLIPLLGDRMLSRDAEPTRAQEAEIRKMLGSGSVIDRARAARFVEVPPTFFDDLLGGS